MGDTTGLEDYTFVILPDETPEQADYWNAEDEGGAEYYPPPVK